MFLSFSIFYLFLIFMIFEKHNKCWQSSVNMNIKIDFVSFFIMKIIKANHINVMIYREQGMQTSILPWLFLMHPSRYSINTCYSQHSFSLNTNHFLKHRPFLFIAVNYGCRKCEHSIDIRPKDRETQRFPCKEVNK